MQSSDLFPKVLGESFGIIRAFEASNSEGIVRLPLPLLKLMSFFMAQPVIFTSSLAE
jgi:hypothetical protein